jgi:hypothetical protein
MNKITPITINIDFDGTCTTHDFPLIGKDIGAVPVLKELVAVGHKLILFTMRSDKPDVTTLDPSIYGESGKYLSEAVEWFRQNDIPLYGIQSNPTQKSWTTSPKSYAVLMIDDSALNCPLKLDYTLSKRPFVDWEEVRKILVQSNLLNE